MSRKRIIKTLIGLGLTNNEVEVYLFLALHGSHTLNEIAVALNESMDSTITYLNELQSLSLVKISVENPEKYTAVPFEDVINLFIDVKKEQVKTMKSQKEELISNWKKLLKKHLHARIVELDMLLGI